MEAKVPTALPFSVGDRLIYASYGLYCIDDIRAESFVSGQKCVYYVMHAQSDPNSTVYVPIDSALTASMRRLLTKNEILDIIEASKDYELPWSDNIKKRAVTLSALVASGERLPQLKIVQVMNRLKSEQNEQQKRKLYSGDLKVLATSEKLIREEFSYVLGIEQNQIFDYIETLTNK